MDTGKGVFEQIKAANDEEMKAKMLELEGKFPNHGGWFREGEEIEIRGSLFRIQSVKPNQLRLKLLKKVAKGA